MKTLALMLVLAAPPPEPEPEASPAPTTTPAPDPAPAPAPVPPQTVEDHRAGLPGSAEGVHPLRGFAAAGVHVYLGNGWNRDSSVDDPPRSEDYLGGDLRAGAIYEVAPRFAAVAQAGGHQGTHALGEGGASEAEPVTVSYSLYYLTAGGRWQSRPAATGVYVEAGGGLAVGRVVTMRPDDRVDAVEREAYPTFAGFAAVGATARIARGMDLFLEARWMAAPGAARSFTSDDTLDLGGLTTSAGIALRL